MAFIFMGCSSPQTAFDYRRILDEDTSGLKGAVLMIREYVYESNKVFQTLEEEEEEAQLKSLLFNNQGGLIAINQYDITTGRYSKEINHHNPDGTRREYKRLAYNDSVVEAVHHRYDAQKNRIKTEGENLVLKQVYSWKYQYDAQNRLVEAVKYDGEEELQEVHNFEYTGEPSELTIFKYASDSSVVFREKKQYDKNLNLIRKKEAVYNTALYPDWIPQRNYTFEYDYDQNGNWVLCMQYENDKFIRLVRREIDYLDN